MRLAIVLSAIAATAVAPAFASAQDGRPVFKFKYTNKEPGASSGFKLNITFPAPSQSLRGIKLYLAQGSRLDADGAPLCTAPREQRVGSGHETACPSGSRMGGGLAKAVVGSGSAYADLVFWNVRAGNLDVLNVEQRIDGRRLPPFSGTLGARSIDFRFSSFQRLFLVGAAVRGSTQRTGGDEVAYLRTPARCPRDGLWNVAAVLNFEDHTRQVLRTTARCSRAT